MVKCDLDLQGQTALSRTDLGRVFFTFRTQMSTLHYFLAYINVKFNIEVHHNMRIYILQLEFKNFENWIF